MRTKVYLFFCRLNFSLTVLMFLYRTALTILSSIIIVNVAKRQNKKNNVKKIKEKKSILCVQYVKYHHHYIIIIIHRSMISCFFVLVIVLIFVIDINFKWKQQTRREGQTLNDDFPFILYLSSSILFSYKVHAYSINCFFLLLILDNDCYFILTYILR